jgi:hypothetical protein
MWQAHYKTITNVSAKALFHTMADVNNWNQWADDLEYAKIKGVATSGAQFILKPKGGPKLKMHIDRFEPHAHFSDITHLPLAKMRISKSFTEINGQTHFTMKVEVWGVLGFLWRYIIATDQIKGAPVQCEKMFNYAQLRHL